MGTNSLCRVRMVYGTNGLGYEWSRVRTVQGTNSLYRVRIVQGTNSLGYEQSKVRTVQGTNGLGYERSRVRIVYIGYEWSRVRIVQGTNSPDTLWYTLWVGIFCVRRIYERPHRYCLENGKSLCLPIWFPYGRFRSGFARGCQKVVDFSCQNLVAKFQGVSEKLRCILLVQAISMGEVENFEMQPEVLTAAAMRSYVKLL